MESAEKELDLEELRALVENSFRSGDCYYYISPGKLLTVLDEVDRLKGVLSTTNGALVFGKKGSQVITPSDIQTFKPGDVFQVSEAHGRAGWVGALLIAEDIHPWGVLGFVAHIKTHEEQARVYIRLKWEELYFIGRAALVPSDLAGGHDDETKEENESP
jgi:hypothetical protein